MLSSAPDWPKDIEQPPLPDGYEWVCLRPALGLKMANGCHPYFVRVRQSKRHGRFVKTPSEYYDTPQQAIDAALMAVERKIK